MSTTRERESFRGHGLIQINDDRWSAPQYYKGRTIDPATAAFKEIKDMLRKSTVALAIALVLGGAFIATDAFAARGGGGSHGGGGHGGGHGGGGHGGGHGGRGGGHRGGGFGGGGYGGGGYGGAYGGDYGPGYGFGGCLPIPVPIVGCW